MWCCLGCRCVLSLFLFVVVCVSWLLQECHSDGGDGSEEEEYGVGGVA